MDDILKVLVYIIAIIIYAIFKMRKKPDGPETQEEQKVAPKQKLPHTTPAKSFADAPPKKVATLNETIKNLNKEIQNSKKTVKPERHLSSGKVYQNKEISKKEANSLEATFGSSEVPSRNIQDHFEKIQNYNEARSYETGLEDKGLFFEYPSEEKQAVNPYAEFLKDPDNIKKVIVMKEIFDRKHF